MKASPMRHRTPLRRRIAKLLSAGANLVGLPIALAWPRSPRIWAFGHEEGAFADNPKYLFLWLRLYRPDIDARWITASAETYRMLRSNGLPAHMRWSRSGMLAALRASAFIFAHDAKDVNAPFSWGAIRLNLWHGVSLKSLHVGRPPGLAGWLRTALLVPQDRVASTSDMTQANFARQFQLPPDRCPLLGYPRLDPAADKQLAQAAAEIDRGAGFELNRDGFAEVYLYAPTFRDTRRSFLQDALPDLARLSSALAARNAVLYVKLHPRTAETLPGSYGNIRAWPKGVDFYTYLIEFTGLITDYSSILYDYIAVRSTGAIVYTFDFDEYISRDRALIASFEENVTGLRVSHFDHLCAALRDGAALDPALTGPVNRLVELFWGGSPVPSSPAVAAYLENELRA